MHDGCSFRCLIQGHIENLTIRSELLCGVGGPSNRIAGETVGGEALAESRKVARGLRIQGCLTLLSSAIRVLRKANAFLDVSKSVFCSPLTIPRHGTIHYAVAASSRRRLPTLGSVLDCHTHGIAEMIHPPQVGYCTNVHAGVDLDAIRTNLDRCRSGSGSGDSEDLGVGLDSG